MDGADCRHCFAGAKAAEIRGYPKALAKSTWQLVSWLTHAANAVRYDGALAVDATMLCSTPTAQRFCGTSGRRPTGVRCSSVRIQVVDEPTFESGVGIACDSCGFVEDASQETRELVEGLPGSLVI